MKELKELEEETKAKAEALLVSCRELGILLMVTQTYRSFQEQAELYAQGRTKSGQIVTHAPPGYSWHNWRRAFDVAIKFYPGDRTKDPYDGPWETVGDRGETLGLEWGGRWKYPDRPHFQNTDGLALLQLIRQFPFGL